MPACQLKEFLRRGIQPGWQDNARDGADIPRPGETQGEPGQPVPVGLFVVIEKCDDLTDRGRCAGVAGP